MRILHRVTTPGEPGECKVMCDEPEDLWHLYNLIQPGDRVKTKTYRKVISEGSTGSTKSKKVRCCWLALRLSVWLSVFQHKCPQSFGR